MIHFVKHNHYIGKGNNLTKSWLIRNNTFV